MVWARRPGKLFSRRMTRVKVGGHDALARQLFAGSTKSILFWFRRLGRNFGSFTWKLKHFKFQRPCRGLSPGKGFAPKGREKTERNIMLFMAEINRKPGHVIQDLEGRWYRATSDGHNLHVLFIDESCCNTWLRQGPFLEGRFVIGQKGFASKSILAKL